MAFAGRNRELFDARIPISQPGNAGIPLCSPAARTQIIKAHGFKRTPTAIMVRAERLSLSRRTHGTYSARTAALVLGLDNKTVSIHCLNGTIKSSRRKTKRLPQQGGDPHSIVRADLRQFVIENVELIDFRKVDKFAIVELLVGENDNVA